MGEAKTTNKTIPTKASVESFLSSLSESRQGEARKLIAMMHEITRQKPVMWGPSIIGFGKQHYKYDTGREGDMPRLGFSPRKTSITIYFTEGFGRYGSVLASLGKHKQSVSCLYINKLADVNLRILRKMLKQSFKLAAKSRPKLTTVADYVSSVPHASRAKFDELRRIVKDALPIAEEMISYGIVGYRFGNKRARVYISGWKDHVAMYPVPKEKSLQTALAPYIKGKGTLWFALDQPLPKSLIKRTVKALIS